ncbi:hypothetical protein [Actinomadura craniellae]|uniref:hypothetical protein n=1 Tax=Actinomadura craniellae TaxID=2231787 RepID=UPI0018F15F33|nr:hypothetical protein [Actinomadura craniellae]
MFVRRCCFALFWIVLALYVLRHPAAAADTATALAHGLGTLADALAVFASVF